ncbi:MAG: (4S)-4-hydroxy-5-phosphonooxypentane-2,3-dione isomerase [Pseudomonadota bacterium]|nr:(4S)-4-hydroxy-5-phosphonooxypentane-2,3-dione isomerase [Pseudomonadota bacterium]
MYVTIVEVHVKKEYVSNFIEATRINHLASVKEKGNRRFDVLQMTDEATRFVLYEAFASAEAAAAHKKTEHYLQWRATVSDWMATLRKGTTYNGLFPE